MTYADLFSALEKASTRLGRKVAPTIYSPKELTRRREQKNAFVTRVLEQPKIWLIAARKISALENLSGQASRFGRPRSGQLR